MKKSLLLLFCLSIVMITLGGCGQYGNLYLPPPEKATPAR